MHQSTFYTLAYHHWPISSGLLWSMFVCDSSFIPVCVPTSVCVCVCAHVHRRSGCSSDSLFADRNEHAVSLGSAVSRIRRGGGVEKKERKNDRRGEAHRTPPIYHPDSFRPLPRRGRGEREREMKQMKTAKPEQQKHKRS